MVTALTSQPGVGVSTEPRNAVGAQKMLIIIMIVDAIGILKVSEAKLGGFQELLHGNPKGCSRVGITFNPFLQIGKQRG